MFSFDTFAARKFSLLNLYSQNIHNHNSRRSTLSVFFFLAILNFIYAQDTTPPVINCPADITAYSPSDGCAAIVDFEVTATDDSGSVTVITNIPSGSLFDPFLSSSVAAIATDAAGNSSTCSFLVTVLDTLAPVLTCPDDVTITTVPGSCTASIFFSPEATAQDNCIQLEQPVGNQLFVYPAGESTVTWTAADFFGNVGSCSTKVTVDDGIAPIALCQDITITVPSGGSLTISADEVDNGSFDSCTGVSLSVSPDTFDNSMVGPNTVTLFVEDETGNISECQATVTVDGPVGTPEITCPADLSLSYDGLNAQDAAIQTWLDSAMAIDASGALLVVNNDYAATSFSECEGLGTQVVTFSTASGLTCTATVTTTYTEATCSSQDFESLNTGDIVSNQLPGVTVFGASNDNPGNLAMIFDSANPTGGDHDLFSAVHGMVLIISEDGDSSDPDDEAHGGVITFDFDTPQYVQEMGFLDIENPGSTVRLFDAAGTLIQEIAIPSFGDGNAGDIIINVEDVSKIEVELMTSGAVTDFCTYDQDFIPVCIDIACKARPACETENFEGFSAGDILSGQIAGTTISGTSNSFPSANTAMIFDSQNPTGGDNDLYTTSEGMVLILSEDGDANDPDDDAQGGVLTFDFATPQYVQNVTVLDIENGGSNIKLFSSTGTLISTIAIHSTGNGNLGTIAINTDDVSSMEIEFMTSGAVVDYCTYDSGSVIECPPVTCDVQVLYSDFEGSANGGYGIWTDGGNDCLHYYFGSPRAIDTYAVRLRDDSNSSKVTSPEFDLSSYESLTLDFSYYTQGVENGEKFLFEISLDGGANYSTVESWKRGTDFNNNTRYYETVDMAGPFSSTVKFRFRNDMSHNNDRVHLDNILIDGCTTNTSSSRVIPTEVVSVSSEEELLDSSDKTDHLDVNPGLESVITNDDKASVIRLYPNPVSALLSVTGMDDNMEFHIINVNGMIVKTGKLNSNQINVEDLNSGSYVLRAADGRVTRFIKF